MIIGLVGKPNCGKSTFFKAATLAEVEIANYPFTTIEANKGVAYVKIDCVDKELNTQCKPKFGYCLKNKRFIPVEIIDVAGLVPEAHKGKGRGNQFLDDIRQADVLIHIVDISGSTNEQGEEIEKGSYDPSKDIEFLEYELDMWYFQILKKGWEKFARSLQQEKNIAKAIAKQLSGLKVTEEMIEDSIKELKNKKPAEWNEKELMNLTKELRKKSKPIIIAANKIDIDIKNNYEKIKKDLIIPCSAESELALKEAAKHDLIDYIPGDSKFEIKGSLNEKQKNALKFIKEKILQKHKTTGVQDVLDKAIFKLLDYIAVYPVPNASLKDSEGNILPDCYLIPKNSTALDLAYKIHTDIGNNFIKAIDIKTKKPIGKDHKLKHLDVIEIMTRK